MLGIKFKARDSIGRVYPTHINLLKKTTTISGYHKKTWVGSKLKPIFYYKLTRTPCKKNGRTESGKITVYSKGRYEKHKNFKQISSFCGFKYFVYCI